MTLDDAFDGVGGPRGLFPADLPWTAEAGYVVEKPPPLIDEALARALAKTRPESIASQDQAHLTP